MSAGPRGNSKQPRHNGSLLALLIFCSLCLTHCGNGANQDDPQTLGQAVAEDAEVEGSQSKADSARLDDTSAADADPGEAEGILELTPDLEISVSTDDLPQIKERSYVRALVSLNRTNFYVSGAQPYGLEYELLQAYEKFLNEGRTRRELRIEVIFLPVPFDSLIPALLGGRGDIAAAGLTITPARAEKVAFSIPYLPDVEEIVVSHKAAPAIESADDLAGRQIYVLRGSSYVQHLETLSRRLEERGLAAIDIVEASRYLQTEDLFEMVNAGIVDFTVADAHVAALWKGVLTELVLHPAVVVNAGGSLAWAVRPDNPELLASVNAFLKKNRKGSLLGNILFERYFEDIRWVTNPTSKSQQQRLQTMTPMFQKYADQYGHDWVLLAALGYQESKLNQKKVSAAGAIGVMQLLPTTAADRNVGLPDIHELETNIHAGAKYLRFIEDRYFSGPAISEEARKHFALAAYNAGPRKVARMRAKAAEMGLDPNKWFLNVERAALRVVGQEPVIYVANINKYYTAYQLFIANEERREAVRAETP